VLTERGRKSRDRAFTSRDSCFLAKGERRCTTGKTRRVFVILSTAAAKKLRSLKKELEILTEHAKGEQKWGYLKQANQLGTDSGNKLSIRGGRMRGKIFGESPTIKEETAGGGSNPSRFWNHSVK